MPATATTTSWSRPTAAPTGTRGGSTTSGRSRTSRSRSAAGDREAVRLLVDRADVVVENLGESAARLGFGHEDAAAAHEKLVWCSVTGLGAGRGGRGGRAVDPSLQASMGMMALTGEPDGP